MAQTVRIDEADIRRVTDAVTAAEARSDAEIATIVSERSDSYNDVPLIWAALVALLALAVYAAFPGFYIGLLDRVTGGWHVWTMREWMTVLVFATTIKFLATRYIVGWWPLRMAFTPGRTKTRRVRARAVALFKASTEQRTLSRTGVLLYLSLAEHRAEIVADEAIVAKVSPDAWGAAMALLIDGCKAGRPADGMVAAVGAIGEVLAVHFPAPAPTPTRFPTG
ncbi:TPM domain-containing protein [Rhizorhabdus histidinilytica]